MVISRASYCQYLLSSQSNYTLTNYSEHVKGISHDSVRRYLKRDKLSARLVWEHAKGEVVESENGLVLFDDTVLDKNYSRSIDGVRWQYSGTVHDVIRGIGVLNCVYVNPELNKYWIIDYRVFDPDKDGYSKPDHLSDMLKNVHYQKKLSFKYVLMDSWYATRNLMLQIDELGKIFYCPLKSNRLVDDSKGVRSYTQVSKLQWNEEQLVHGKIIKIKKFPGDYRVKLFRVTVSSNRTDYVVTNDITQNDIDDVQEVYSRRWNIEEFHRELKQLTGIECCQCRLNRIQRNHIACAMMVWTCLKRHANDLRTSVYQIKKGLLREYLIQQLRRPSVGFA